MPHGVGIARVVLQDLAIDLLGLVEVPGSMVLHAQGQGLGTVGHKDLATQSFCSSGAPGGKRG